MRSHDSQIYFAVSIKEWIKNEVLFSGYSNLMNILFTMFIFAKTFISLVILLLKKSLHRFTRFLNCTFLNELGKLLCLYH